MDVEAELARVEKSLAATQDALEAEKAKRVEANAGWLAAVRRWATPFGCGRHAAVVTVADTRVIPGIAGTCPICGPREGDRYPAEYIGAAMERAEKVEAQLAEARAEIERLNEDQDEQLTRENVELLYDSIKTLTFRRQEAESRLADAMMVLEALYVTVGKRWLSAFPVVRDPAVISAWKRLREGR